MGSGEGSRKPRKHNFSAPEISILTEKVEENLAILQSKFTNSLTNLKKKQVWSEITSAVNAVGVGKRTETEVREKWKNLHSAAKREFTKFRQESKKTGGGPAPKEISAATSKVIELFQDTPSFIDTFMRPMTTERRQTVIMGKENFPLDISERETLHAIIKKHPELGKTSQNRRIGGKMESCICIYLSSFPSEVRTQIQQVLQITGSTSENHSSSDNSAADNQRNRSTSGNQPPSDNSAADNPRKRSTSENQPPSDNSAADNQRNRSTSGNLANNENSAADHAFEVSSCVVPVVEDETDDDILLSAACCSTSVDVEEIQGEQGDKTAKRKNTKKMEEVQPERRSKRKRGAKRF
ncbi:uncharacterized protein [Montipora capricornis]|uniref:uncharacterized protein n=1 Tax=Montipora capricornis TaxID=246305 RepID=UPI0035F13AA4